MNTTRMEAFSDGVIAIIITIMVLELKVPHGDTLGALLPLIPVLLSYVLSFAYVGITGQNQYADVLDDSRRAQAVDLLLGHAQSLREHFLSLRAQGRRRGSIGHGGFGKS
jgi:hypothetical protein